MMWRAVRRWSAVLTSCWLALIVLCAMTPTADAEPQRPALTWRADQTSNVRLAITSLGPDLLTHAGSVQVAGTVTNTSGRALSQVSVRLRAIGGRLGTRVVLDQWLDGHDERQGVPVEPSVTVADTLAPGARAGFRLAVPVAALGLVAQEFGSYPIAVEVRGTPAQQGREQLAFVRTTVQWQPASKQYAVQRISWVLPLTDLLMAPGHDRLNVQQVAAQLAPGGRMARLLRAASIPGVVWAVDPHLLMTLQKAASPDGRASDPTPTTSASAPSDSPSATPSSTPSITATEAPAQRAARAVVRDYLVALRQAAAGREVIELPYADPDLQVAHDAGAMDLLTAARAAGARRVSSALGVQVRTDVAWPAGGSATDRLVKDLSSQGLRSLLLDGRTRPLADPQNYTTDARTTSLPGAGTAVLADGQLSDLAGSLRSGDALLRNRFLAETAAATTERSGVGRRLLVAVPRGSDPDPTALRSLVGTSVPWLAPATFTELLTPIAGRADTSRLARHAIPPPAAARTPAGVRIPDVETVGSLRSELSGLGEVLADPASTTVPLQRSALELLSAGWRGHRRELLAREQLQLAAVQRLSDQLRVLPSTITFLRSEGQLQLTISNDLDQRVQRVRLRVVATSPKLVVSQELSAVGDLGAGTRTSVRVPVRAIASGEVELQAQLLAPSGALIGHAEQVQVRVRPTDGWVLTIGGVGVGLVVAVGLVRSLRRPRRLSAATTTSLDNDKPPEFEP